MPSLLGRIASPPDARDYQVRSLLDVGAIAPVLPRHFQNRTLGGTMRMRFDQQESSCVGRSTALMKVVQERRDLRRTIIFDGLAIWRRSKENDGIGNPNEDRGTFIRTALKLLTEGAPWKWLNSEAVAWDPRMRVLSYWRISNIDEAKAAIMALGPIVVGADWYDSWFRPDPTTHLLPSPDSVAGGHAFVLYGWDDQVGAHGAFRLANSWGLAWGDNGDAWIGFEHFGAAIDEAWRVVDAIDV